ncbi:MAG TPA: dihydrolipoyl dehydrogenase, partial [Desulfobacteraceae bacterium]|nr:dihydrolipoyl dehydrogenase [Desulfobacteraceae bacterium]
MTKQLVIIGGGPGGYVAALKGAALGARVTLIEKENLGGTCLNWGCIPSKIMKNSADLLLKCLEADKMGIQIEGHVSADMTALMARKDKILEDQRKGIEGLMEANGISVLFGKGKIAGPGKVSVTDAAGEETIVDYDKLIIATGTKPLNVLDFPFDHTRVVSSNDILCLDRIPASMTIVGGGVIGCEFAFIFSALGCQVTVVEAMSRLLPLPSVDESCSKLLMREMKKRKIKVFCDTVVTKAEAGDAGVSVSLSVSPFTDNPKPKKLKTDTLESEIMAVCIGRTPLSEDLGLENIGLQTERGWIPANEFMETAADNVYAIGDILGPAKIMLAHVASHEGLVAAENALSDTGTKAVMAYNAVPGAIFTMPEVGTVGLSEEGAKAAGFEVETASVNFRVLGKAQAIG